MTRQGGTYYFQIEEYKSLYGEFSVKKFLYLFLCLLMVVSVLAACKTPSVQDEGPVVEIDLSHYKIIYPQKLSTTLLAAATQMKKNINSQTGAAIMLEDDWLKAGTEPDDAAYEILIGVTNRHQSADVQAALSGACYAIEIVGNKIVIVGTNETITADGVNYFIEKYIKTSVNAGNGKIKLPETLKYISEQYRVVSLIEDGKCKYEVIYNDDLDNSADGNGIVDYQVQLAKNIIDKIGNLTGARVTMTTDWVKTGTNTDDKYEILVGTTSRSESVQAREQYDVDEYGVSIVGNKIIITGWTEETIGYAVDIFCTMLEQSLVQNTDKDKNITFLYDTKIIKSRAGWKTDIPEFEGGELYGCVTCNHDQIEYYYSGTTEAAFTAYRQKLASEGYELYCENIIDGNLFATYTKKTTMIHAYYVKNRNAVRIITGSTTGQAKLPTNTDGKPEYIKITESKITQMTHDYDAGSFGNCYVITLEDGSFIIMDGGADTSKKDSLRLFSLLKKLNERQDGKIVIAAWFISHSHGDHVGGLVNLCATYGTGVVIEQFIANTPDKIVYYNSRNPGNAESTFAAVEKSLGSFKLVKPHTGMKFWVRNAQIEILYTQEDIYPDFLREFNNSSMVFKMMIGGQTVMWLGDVEYEGSDIITEMYGAALKSDIVQVSHHGWDGGSLELYNRINPATAFWPTSIKIFTDHTSGKNTTEMTRIVDYYLVKSMNIKDHFLAEPDNIQITLPYVAESGKKAIIAVPVS